MNDPYNTQIELVEGCNLFCKFCGIYGIWDKKENRELKMMDIKLAESISKNLSQWWKKGKRIEFAMHGEPTLHPNILDIIKIFRNDNKNAQLQLTTNGTKLTPVLVQKLFKNGLNLLLIDTYRTSTERKIETILQNINIPYFNYYEKDCPNPYYYNGNKQKCIILFGDLAKNNRKKMQRTICNHAGNSNEKYLTKYGAKKITSPLRKKCTKPFRELIIHWDGTVPLCCMDWKHELIIGKFPIDGNLKKIWHSEIFNIFRNLLYNKQRWFRPCYKCDFTGGPRIGLLKKPELKKVSGIQKEIEKHYSKMDKYAHENSDKFFKINKNIRDFIK